MANLATLPEVLVIVLNWNGADDTRACLDSLRAASSLRAANSLVTAPPSTFDILVIDNGSRQSVAPVVRDAFPSVRCIELPTNLGFAGGNNVGMRYALEHGYRFAYILNNDTAVEAGWLEAALEVAGGERVAAVGAKV